MYIFINQQIIIVNLIIYIQLTGFIKKLNENNLDKKKNTIVDTDMWLTIT